MSLEEKVSCFRPAVSVLTDAVMPAFLKACPAWLVALKPLIAALTYASAAAAAPNVGDVAPDWSLPGSDGEQYSLSQLRGKHVVIAFFPKAFTTG